MLSFRRRLSAWRQINFRAVSSLLAAEFLHRLYQRHHPLLNPLRFENTLVIFRNWQATSYAPRAEWDLLGLRFGGRIVRRLDRFESEILRCLSNPRTHSTRLAECLEQTDLGQLDDAAFGDLLLEAHHTPLGEIYEVNLVQFEHALHTALRTRYLKIGDTETEKEKEEDVDVRIAQLLAAAPPTCAAGLEAAFLRLVRDVQTGAACRDAGLDARLADLTEQHRALGAAYGAATVTLDDIRYRFEAFAAQSRDEVAGRLLRLGQSLIRSEASLELEDPICRRLAELLRETGSVRDRNKALLGRITCHRVRFLEEISRRRDVPAASLRLYLLEELLALLEDGHRVPDPQIDARARRGVVFSRLEDVTWPNDAAPWVEMPRELTPDDRMLHGLCASPGVYTGTVRIVHDANDVRRMRVGDVLVSKGTDFDLALLIQMAGAVITEEGGLLSHASVLTRELGIPCLINVTGATRALSDGDIVCVDARLGRASAVSSRESDSTKPSGAEDLDADPRLLCLVDETLGTPVGGRKAHVLGLLGSWGIPIPKSLRVVPTSVCERIEQELASDVTTTLHRVARTIVQLFEGQRLVLRSSMTTEDAVDGSSAGIYESVVDVQPRVHDVATAMRTIIVAAGRPAARTYAERVTGASVSRMAVIVAPYLEFAFQGTSYSESLSDPETVLVEWFESSGSGGCPSGGGTAIELRRATLSDARRPAAPALTRDLQSVASLTVHIERVMGKPVQVEWGLRNHEVVALQARPITALAGRRASACDGLRPEHLDELVARLVAGDIPVRQGRSHVHGTFQIAGRTVIIKACTDKRRLPRLVTEHTWLSRLYPLRPYLVPEPLGFRELAGTPYYGALVTSSVEGQSLRKLLDAPDRDRRMLARQYGQALADLHDVRIDAGEVSFDGDRWRTWSDFVAGSVRQYVEDIGRLGGELPAALAAAIDDALTACADDLSPESLVPLHGDPTPDNLIFGSGRRVFVDFEVGQTGDRWLDFAIAGVLWLDDDPELWPETLNGYGRRPAEGDLLRMRVYRMLRLLRLMRGKLWIYRDGTGFAANRDQLARLLHEDRHVGVTAN